MSLLECSRCGAKTQCESITKGKDNLDHAVGKTRGKPCGPGVAQLIFDGVYERNITESKKESKTKSKNTFKD